MFWFLFSNSVSQQYSFSDNILTSVTLKNGDTIFINATDKNAFLHISPHFFFGELTITASSDVDNTTIKAQASQRLQFKYSTIEIVYSSSPALCKVDIFLTNIQTCNEKTIHVRGAKSTTISADHLVVDYNLCYWFDFLTNSSYSFDIDHSNSTFPTVFYKNSQDNFVQEKYDELSVSTLPNMFILRLPAGKYNISQMSFSISRSFGDWTDQSSTFDCWPQDHCGSVKNLFYLTESRGVSWLIWTTLILGLSIPAIIILFCMFSKPAEVILTGASAQPLVTAK